MMNKIPGISQNLTPANKLLIKKILNLKIIWYILSDHA